MELDEWAVGRTSVGRTVGRSGGEQKWSRCAGVITVQNSDSLPINFDRTAFERVMFKKVARATGIAIDVAGRGVGGITKQRDNPFYITGTFVISLLV